MATKLSGPGIAKVRRPPLVMRRHLSLVSILEGRWRDLLNDADVVSEGRCRDERGGRVYYGSTSLLLLSDAAGGRIPNGDVAALVGLLERDPHVRVRAVRVAHREASSRAEAPLGPLHAEIRVTSSARGLTMDIDVTAAVFAPRRRART